MAQERTDIQNRPEVVIAVEDVVPGGLVINAEIPEELVDALINWVEKEKRGTLTTPKDSLMYEESRRTLHVNDDSYGVGIYCDSEVGEAGTLRKRFSLHCSGIIARELEEEGFITLMSELEELEKTVAGTD